MPNRLPTLLPGGGLSEIIRVLDIKDIPDKCRMNLVANAVEQNLLCFMT
jgi:hypothetical protein